VVPGCPFACDNAVKSAVLAILRWNRRDWRALMRQSFGS
jgi:hypothetical protein